MNNAVLLLVLLNFAYIGLLPVIFFKKGGKLNAMWWLTATPFLLCTVFLIAAFASRVPTFVGYVTPLGHTLTLVSTLSSAASIALISFTLGSHRIPIALWHQTDDAPRHIVTWGAYQHIRHPFYTSFLLAFAAAFLLSPQWGTLATLIYGFTVLNATAAREERRLSDSEFGEQYGRYMKRTGRFLPKWGRQEA
ncbi:MAG TPA: isoprenylcysteine carboxylmethyltransferase family protein [Candidatus Obscuribacterales bacterium]